MLSHSYFITSQMGAHLSRGQLNTLPLLYVFLARSGKTVRDVSYVQLSPTAPSSPTKHRRARAIAVKIVLRGGGKEQTLYYQHQSANDGVAKGGFLKFCERLGTGDSFVKSVLSAAQRRPAGREFMLKNSTHILQDDTGNSREPLKEDAWRCSLRPLFTPDPGVCAQLSAPAQTLFDQGKPPLDFGIGYKWRAANRT